MEVAILSRHISIHHISFTTQANSLTSPPALTLQRKSCERNSTFAKISRVNAPSSLVGAAHSPPAGVPATPAFLASITLGHYARLAVPQLPSNHPGIFCPSRARCSAHSSAALHHVKIRKEAIAPPQPSSDDAGAREGDSAIHKHQRQPLGIKIL
jgi:hypothetical protein